MIINKSRIESFVSIFVTVYPSEVCALIYSTSSFFFILSAYFVVLPLRDEGAISLGLGKLPGLFVGSLLLTLVAAPVSTLIFSLPNLSKRKMAKDSYWPYLEIMHLKNTFIPITSFIVGYDLLFLSTCMFQAMQTLLPIHFGAFWFLFVDFFLQVTMLLLEFNVKVLNVQGKMILTTSIRNILTRGENVLAESSPLPNISSLFGVKHQLKQFNRWLIGVDADDNTPSRNVQEVFSSYSSRENDLIQMALVLIHRFFSLSLLIFFILWIYSMPGSSPINVKERHPMNSTVKVELKVATNQAIPANSAGWENHGWFYIVVRVAMFLWVGLLNLITISSTWARVIDVMDSESGSRLFGFIGAGATLGQLFGSLFATGMAWLGPYLLLFAALLLEFAAQSSKGIEKDISRHPEELSPIREADPDHMSETNDPRETAPKASLPRTSTSTGRPQSWAVIEGVQLILSSSYLLQVALFLWLSAVVSSFFYFQKVTVIATTVASPVGRRRLFAQINSFIAVFILGGQLTLTGHILTIAGVTIAICSTPFVAFINLIALAVWPSWIAVAISETLRKVVTYVVTRPGRELLFTVVTQDEKYKAKVCIDVIVQRLGDATAAGMYKLLFSNLHGKASRVSLYALPVCFLWIVTAFHLGHWQTQLAKFRAT